MLLIYENQIVFINGILGAVYIFWGYAVLEIIKLQCLTPCLLGTKSLEVQLTLSTNGLTHKHHLAGQKFTEK